MKDYELTVLFHPDLEMNLDPAVDKVKKIIESNHGTITNEENDGKKHLSYKIEGQDFAVFYYFDVQLPAEAPAKISNTMNITDEIIRYLLVRASGHKKGEAKEEESATSSEATEETTKTKSTEKGE